MTKKLNKRPLSEKTLAEKSEKEDGKDSSSSPKKQKLEMVSDANAVTKKAKKPVASQNNVNVNKNKKGKNKNEKNVTSPKIKQNKESTNDDEPIVQSISRKDKLLLQKVENKKAMKEKRKVFRKEEGQVKTMTSKLSIEQIQEKIDELKSRDTLSKSAKKKLAALRKILKIQDEGNIKESNDSSSDDKSDIKKTVYNNKGHKLILYHNMKMNVSDNNDKKIVEKDTKSLTAKSANKKKSKEQKISKQQKDEDEDEDADEVEDEDEDMEDPNEEEKNKIQVKSKKPFNMVKQVKKDEDDDENDDEDDDEDEEEEEEGDEEEEEEDEKVEKEEGDDDDDDDDDDDEEEDEDEENDDDNDDNDDDENVKTEEESKEKVADKKLKKNETANNKNQSPKKKRYVLYVANIPYSIIEDEIKDHFLTKVSSISDIRLPKKVNSNLCRGFCYIEFDNQEDYEKGLSLDRSILHNRMLTVKYTTDSKRDNAKQIITAKNKKLAALRDQGKLAGSHKKTDKKFKKGFKKNPESSTA